MLFRKNFIKTILLIFLLSSSYTWTVFAMLEQDQISEVIIEGRGNNVYESKIKAQEYGLRRVFLLLTDKWGIHKHKELLPLIDYNDLKKIFTPILVTNELSSEKEYKAMITYAYDRVQFIRLLANYKSDYINDLFYNYLVIPVVKRGNKIDVWGNGKTGEQWYNNWNSFRIVLENNKMLYPENSLFIEQKIHEKNLFSLNFEDFLSIFDKSLFKSVMIVVAEYFTNFENNKYILKVKCFLMDFEVINHSLIYEENFIINNVKDINGIIKRFIDNLIDKYGILRNNTSYDSQDLSNNITNAEDLSPLQQDLTRLVVMYFNVYDQEELSIIEQKIKKVAQIINFSIEKEAESSYKINIYTNHSDYDLAEGLYFNGLSYSINNNVRSLINVQQGI